MDRDRGPAPQELPLRPCPSSATFPQDNYQEASAHADTTPSSALSSPGIKIDFHGSLGEAADPKLSPLPVPISSKSWPSPIRHHRRTPSAHREIKETLNARSEYTSNDVDGRSHHRINQYIIKEEIGRGSYGAVHLAVDQFGKEYAVKEFSKARLRKREQSNVLRQGPRGPGRRLPFRPDFRGTGGLGDRPLDRPKDGPSDALYLIREEIAIMKKLNHENLVQLIEVLDDPEEDSLYMVLEMCKKGVIMQVGLGQVADPYPEEATRYWFRDLILGIEYLHASGVVHRDIKPDNLLLTEDDVLKIVDFGVSELFEKPQDMRTAKSAGSPAFLPPELCVGRHGEVSGTAADIWSMGVSLYCLRYGKIPFECDGVLEMYEAIKTKTPQLPENEDPVFVDLMQKLMEKDPDKRIKMEELRTHAWVTKGGTDLLLSSEENCSEQVELPNDLELNHAFTQKMSHLLCVMKAITRFKGLLNHKEGTASPFTEHQGQPQPTETKAPQKTNTEKTNREHAEEVLRERERFFATFSGTSGSWQALPGEKGHAHDPTDAEPLLLGIGTGSMDEFSTPQPQADVQPTDVVSDSPVAVDFNIYDRAFEDEVAKIQRSTSRRQRAGGMFHTKHLRDRRKYRNGDSMEWIDEPEDETPGSDRPVRTPKLMDLVTQAVDEAKNKAKEAK